MYVSYEYYTTLKHGYNPVHPDEKGEENTEPVKVEMNEDTYMRLSVWADALIDDWLLGRVGHAIECERELPIQVVSLYCAIIDGLPALMEASNEGTGAPVTSFSNGVDSYSFDTTKSAADGLRTSLAWMVEALPLEWSSRCLYSEMECCHARRPR